MPAIERAEKPKLWKDYIDRASLERFGAVVRAAYPKFDTDHFVTALVREKFDRLELKARICLIAKRLHDHLPKNYSSAVDILIKVAPSIDGFYNWVLSSYVDQFGMDDLANSVRAMEVLTTHGTSEFSIRPFIAKYPDQMLKVIHRWAADKNEHLRRLAAEGTRPRGVWTIHLDLFRKDPRPVLALLEKLKADDSLYVRKAVANNLNDISKDHPELLLKTTLAWMKANDPRTNWILKRGCRSLIKKGHPDVFKLFGFTSKPQVEVRRLKITPARLSIGDNTSISFAIVSQSTKSQKLAIDYKVHYVKANGKSSAKVFKLTEKSLQPGESIVLSTKHSFRDLSTRKHFSGRHAVEVVVNGLSLATARFTLA